MDKPSPLEDPDRAQFAWGRYRRLMVAMCLVTLVVVGIALALLYWRNGAISMHFYIATGLGIFATMMLTGLLMGLVFLSSGTGHDESIEDPLEDHADSFRGKP